MVKLLRRATGAALRSMGLYPAYERLYFRLKFPRPVRYELDDVPVSLWMDAPSTRRYLETFPRSEAELLRFIRDHVRPGDTIWDVGANKGIFSLFFSAYAGPSGRVYAFEPEQKAYTALVRNLRASNCPNVDPMRCALGVANKTAKLRLCGAGDHSLVEDFEGGQGEETIEVRQGDSLLAEGILAPAAIKIDVEGAEFAVLEGMKGILSQGGVRCVGIELHDHLLAKSIQDPFGKLCELMQGYGLGMKESKRRGTELHVFFSRKGAAE